MKPLRCLALAACGLALVGCGGNESEPEAPGASTTAAAAGTDATLIPAEVVSGCASVTGESAARLLDVDAAVLTDYSRTEGAGQTCLYRDPNDYSRNVSFTLNRKDSIDAARASMARERDSMGQAQAAIDGVMGSTSKEAAVQDVSDIGDEAFLSPLNGAIMLRVDNVIAQVAGPHDMARKRAVAEAVAEGLQQ